MNGLCSNEKRTEESKHDTGNATGPDANNSQAHSRFGLPLLGIVRAGMTWNPLARPLPSRHHSSGSLDRAFYGFRTYSVPTYHGRYSLDAEPFESAGWVCIQSILEAGTDGLRVMDQCRNRCYISPRESNLLVPDSQQVLQT